MKRKRPAEAERRRPLAEVNLVDEPKRLGVSRRGCGPLFGSTLVLLSLAATIWASVR